MRSRGTIPWGPDSGRHSGPLGGRPRVPERPGNGEPSDVVRGPRPESGPSSVRDRHKVHGRARRVERRSPSVCNLVEASTRVSDWVFRSSVSLYGCSANTDEEGHLRGRQGPVRTDISLSVVSVSTSSCALVSVL